MKSLKHTLLASLTLLNSILAFAANKSVNSSMTENQIKTAISSGLSAGDTVFFENGTYTNLLGSAQFKGTGTASKPIVFIARNPGSVIITGNIQVGMNGKFLEINGLLFKDGKVTTQYKDLISFREGTTSDSTKYAYNCRLTNCVVDNCNDESLDPTNDSESERWVMLYGRGNRVDHCYFANKTRAGVLMMMDLSNPASRNNGHRVDHNFFGYRPRIAAGNGGEAIRPGDSKVSQYICASIIEDNYFYEFDGEIEIISLKSCDNIVRRNTFRKSAGMVVCRHGHRNTIESNVFLGDGKSGSGGVRVINQGHKIYNNYFEGLTGTGTRSALCLQNGVFETPTESTNLDCEPLNAYVRAKDVDIAFNTFVSCASIELGTASTYSYSSDSKCAGKAGTSLAGTLAPQNIKVSNNIFYNMPSAPVKANGANISGITFNNNIANTSTSWNYNGITKKDIRMTKANGMYKLDAGTATYCIPALYSVGNFSYVTTDATNSARTNGNDVGAVNYENIAKNYSAAQVSECGVSWYSYSKP